MPHNSANYMSTFTVLSVTSSFEERLSLVKNAFALDIPDLHH